MKNFFHAALFLLPLVSVSQVVEKWVAIDDGFPGSDAWIWEMIVDDSSNIYLLGVTFETDQTGEVEVVKYSEDGSLIWKTIYSTPEDETDGSGFGIDAAHNVYFSFGSSTPSTGPDYLTVKLDASGDPVWSARYNQGNQEDVPRDLLIDENGYIYVTGQSQDTDGHHHSITLKYTNEGDQVWIHDWDYGGTAGHASFDMTSDPNWNLYLAGGGEASPPFFDGHDMELLIVDSSGTLLGTERWSSGNGWEDARNIHRTQEGVIYLSGYTTGAGTGTDLLVMKYNAAGGLQWVRTYDGPEHGDEGMWRGNMVVDDAENVYISGNSSGATTATDWVLIKYDSSGAQQWVHRYDGAAHSEDYAGLIALDTAGNIYITGSGMESGSDSRCLTRKYLPDGTLAWEHVYNGPGDSDDGGYSIAVDETGNVFVAGWTQDSGTDYDLLLIKYGPDNLSVQPPPSPDFHVRVHVDPITGQPEVIITSTQADLVSIALSDASGRQLIREEKIPISPGNTRKVLDVDLSSKGVYLITVASGRSSLTEKFIF